MACCLSRPPSARLARNHLDDLKDRIHAILTANQEEDQDTGCWVWTGAWTNGGSGIMKILGRCFMVRRVAFWVYRRSFDLWDMSRRVVATCSTPACFNPDHSRVVIGQAGVNRSSAARRRLAG